MNKTKSKHHQAENTFKVSCKFKWESCKLQLIEMDIRKLSKLEKQGLSQFWGRFAC